MMWVDITSYSRDDKSRVPQWWQWDKTSLKVGNHHIHYRDEPHWHVSFQGKRFLLAPVKEMSEEEAKSQAIRIAVDNLKAELAKFGEVV